MVIDLIVIGKTDSEPVQELLSEYSKRINRYAKFSVITIPDVRRSKKTDEASLKKQEADLLIKQLRDGDHIVLLDERGAEYTSLRFAEWVQKRLNSSVKRLVFVIGGPYGFHEIIYRLAQESLSLSKMTFSHQLIRVLFTEQLYRAFSILNNEPYHHE